MSDRELAPAELLERIARTLKQDIGPAVGEAYPKTQAFMASVVLQKLAGQLRDAEGRATENRREAEALHRDLRALLGESREAAPALLDDALGRLARDSDTSALTALVETLYRCREELGAERFEALRARTRELLRARLDRALVYSA